MHARPGQRGFSVIELVVVAAILGIIASIAVRRVGGMAQKSRIAALQATVRNVSTVVQEYEGVHGAFPPTIEPAWFTTGVLPRNPYFDGPPTVQVVNLPGVTAPTAKLLGGAAAPYWYNRANGAFRARVSLAAGEDAFVSVNAGALGAVKLGGGAVSVTPD